MTQIEAQLKVINLIQSNLYTQKEIGQKLNITEPTMSKRKKLANWRQVEIDIIKTL